MSILDTNEQIEHRFKANELPKAKRFQAQMKRTYGYKPKIIKIKNTITMKHHYLVVEPKGMKRI